MCKYAAGSASTWRCPCAFAEGAPAGLLGLVTGGLARVPAVQRAAARWAGRLGARLGGARVGQWAKAAAGELATAARRLPVRVTGVPQGLTRAQFREVSTAVRQRARGMGHEDDVVIQGPGSPGCVQRDEFGPDRALLEGRMIWLRDPQA